MIKDLEYILKKIFFSEKYLLKKRLVRSINKSYEKELEIINEYSDKSKVAIDVGVYRGVYTYKLSSLFKNVICFEPNPLLYKYLKENLTKILDNIEIYNYALSDKTGSTSLKIPNRGKSLFSNNYEELYKLGAATIHENNVLSNYESFEVKTKKLDDLIKNENIGFIKIDVEGHETEVIKGSIEIIKKNKPTLLVEIEEKHTKQPIELTIDFIKKLGYECFQYKENRVKLFNIKEHKLKDNNFLFIKK